MTNIVQISYNVSNLDRTRFNPDCMELGEVVSGKFIDKYENTLFVVKLCNQCRHYDICVTDQNTHATYVSKCSCYKDYDTNIKHSVIITSNFERLMVTFFFELNDGSAINITDWAIITNVSKPLFD